MFTELSQMLPTVPFDLTCLMCEAALLCTTTSPQFFIASMAKERKTGRVRSVRDTMFVTYVEDPFPSRRIGEGGRGMSKCKWPNFTFREVKRFL
tara:strand:+ start:378 stop:659 length:282 start_codon:yes stop_codon:yes gene_type:complete